MKRIFLAFFALLISVASFAQIGPIVAPDSICVGDMPTLTSTPSGGTWSSSNPLVASIDSLSGVLMGVAPGVDTITYIAIGDTATFVLTVNPVPSAITCPSTGCSLCIGDSVTVSDSLPGGKWICGNTAIATIDSITGAVTGVSSGSTILTYMLPTGCYVTAPFTVNPSPTLFMVTSSATSYCYGGTGVLVGLSNSQSGINYQLYCGGLPVGGVLPGIGSAISFGLQTGACTYSVVGIFVSTGCLATMNDSIAVTVNPVPDAITCPLTGCKVCAGNSIALTDTTSGGTWTSSTPGTATVNPSTGVVTGISSSIVTITYTLPAGCYVTDPVTVNPSPGSIGGATTVCIGATSTLFNPAPGGTWSSTDITVATIGPSSGIVTGISVGTAMITYTLPGGCFSVTMVTVSPTPTTISGTTTVCIGSTNTLTDGVTGGVWSSSNNSIATVGSFSGLVSGVSAGTATISYQLSSGCYVTLLMTVISSPAPVMGPGTGNNACVFGTIALTDADPGGTWSSSNTAIATADSSSGVVSGVAVGVVTITYSFGGGCLIMTTVTVNALPAPIAGPTDVCLGYTTLVTDTATGGIWSSVGTYATVGSSSGIVTGIAAGMETITYTLPTGCFTTFNETVDPPPCAPTLGINENKAMTGNVELFPNPAYDELTIKTDEGAYSSFTIINSIGQVMMQQTISAKEITVNVKALPPSIYYISFRGENGAIVKRFLKR